MGIQALMALAFMAAAGEGPDPARTLEAFLRAVARADTATAMEMISEDAWGMVDSLLSRDPERLCHLAGGFGVALQPEDIEDLGPRDFIGSVLASPALSGLLVIARWDVSGFEQDGDAAVVRIEYGLMGTTGIMEVSMVREGDRWRLDDYFGGAPMR